MFGRNIGRSQRCAPLITLAYADGKGGDFTLLISWHRWWMEVVQTQFSQVNDNTFSNRWQDILRRDNDDITCMWYPRINIRIGIYQFLPTYL
ncbi:MAG: hypothetical protein DBW91_03720 [Candidatus Thioglobus sp.]|nr:MAG: hypothetical protein DBW91_03720 [Candidatus Thioglobus sp.]